MLSKRLQRLQAGTVVVLFLYLCLLLYMAFIAIPATFPMWNSGVAEHDIQQATTMTQLQSDLRDAVLNLTWGLHVKDRLLLVFSISTIVLIGYLGWTLVVIRRLMKEGASSNDAA